MADAEPDYSLELVREWKQLRRDATGVEAKTTVGMVQAVGTAAGTSSAEAVGAAIPSGSIAFDGHAVTVEIVSSRGISVGAVLINTGPKTPEGQLILAVTPAWRRILDEIVRDSTAVYQLAPRQFEEFNAAAYDEDGWDVTLTPPSGDLGRDIIAVHPDGFRVLVQVKLRKPSRRVTADEVDSLVGVLSRDPAASKAVFTTTSMFAPGVESRFADMTPTRLELRDGPHFQAWLKKIRGES